jgi:hypothetical protein
MRLASRFVIVWGLKVTGMGVKFLLNSQTILCYWNRLARPLRIDYPDAWYHVMNRGRRGENTRGHIVLLLRDNPWFTH